MLGLQRLLVCFAGLALCACASERPYDWVDALGEGSAQTRLAGSGPPAEAFTAERLPIRERPSARELLEAYNYRNATLLAGPSGLWPSLPLLPGISVPDPGYAARRLLGLEFEPRYVMVREANALILRTGRGSVVLPLDPDKPLRFPEDGSPGQRQTRRAFLSDLDRDLRALPSAPEVAP